jgi:hypothetical protein
MRAPASLPFPSSLWLLRPRRLVYLALWSPLLSLAQASATGDAAHPNAATAPLIHQSLPLQPPLADATPSPQTWRDGHAAVSAFPRGHADIVVWEAQQQKAQKPNLGATPTSSHLQAPPHHEMHPGRHRSTPPIHRHTPPHGGKP